MAEGGWARPTATGLAAASIVFVLINGALVLRNENAQAAVNQRQQVIDHGLEVSRAAQLMVQTIGNVAVATKDDALIQVLERHGIHLSPNAPSVAPGTLPTSPSPGTNAPANPGGQGK